MISLTNLSIPNHVEETDNSVNTNMANNINNNINSNISGNITNNMCNKDDKPTSTEPDSSAIKGIVVFPNSYTKCLVTFV